MGQVFNNLLSNAVKFNQKDGRIEIRMTLTASSVDVSVTDTGIGIPQEALDKIFTRFYQYDASSTRKYGGTGIGLSIAQDIVRLHGSRIHATSEVGKGSTFQFSLPLVPAVRDDSRQIGDDSSATEERHILIELVTSDRSLEIEMRNILVSEGLNLIHASRADTAAGLARKHRPDCLVVDVSDPGRDERVLEELLNNSYTGVIPVIMLTSDDELYEKYRASITTRLKPGFRKSSFLSAVHHALSREPISNEPFGDRVLCVDDDIEILSFMNRCLESEGIESDQCTSGEEAMRLVATKKYGLVLLDIAMPGTDGWETCSRIKSDPELSQINVYMVTAKPIHKNLGRMHESGSDGFLLKPFRPEDLIQLVRGLELHTPAK
ncbi:MAG: response regulator [Candidatus Hydrogenedentes bacterium]|nr:response regulator [Candidatus Hydrogenedentota bacterium]